MKNVEYISIPKGLCLALAGNSKQLRTMGVFYQLKSMYVGGIIKNYSPRAKDIAASFGYSERKLRTYITVLKEEGLITIDKNKSLLLKSSQYIGKRFGVAYKQFHKVKLTHVDKLDEVLKGIAISENLVKQAHEVKHKVINKAIAQSVGITTPTNYQPNHVRKLRNLFSKSYDRDLVTFQKRYTDSISNLETPDMDFFPFITLTRQGIANLFNKSSKSTGQRYAKQLSSLGIINDKRSKNVVVLENATWDDYVQLQTTVIGHDYSYKFDKSTNIIYKVLPNDVSLNRDTVIF